LTGRVPQPFVMATAFLRRLQKVRSAKRVCIVVPGQMATRASVPPASLIEFEA